MKYTPFRIYCDCLNMLVGSVAITVYLFSAGDVQLYSAIVFAVSYWISVITLVKGGLDIARSA